MTSPLILAKKKQFEYIQEDLAQRTPLFHCKRAHAEHTQDPQIRKNKTLEDHILLEPYVLSNESRIKIAF